MRKVSARKLTVIVPVLTMLILMAAPSAFGANSTVSIGQFKEYVISCHMGNPFRDCRYLHRPMPSSCAYRDGEIVCVVNQTIPVPANATNTTGSAKLNV